MKSKQVLFCDSRPNSDLLVTAQGEPLWPIHTRDERDALVAIAGLFGGSLQEVTGEPGCARCDSEEVVALGEEAKDPAILYANLTRRQFRVAADLSDLVQSSLPSVVVTTPGWMDEKLMNKLYSERPQQVAPGIIWAASPAELKRQVLIHAAAASLSGPMEQAWIDILPIEEALEPRSDSTRAILSQRSSAQQIKDAVGCGAGVLNVCTHSDGVDVYFGNDLILCPMEDHLKTGNEGQRRPVCWKTGFCNRQMVPIEDALKSGVILPVSAIRARIFIFNTCSGLLHPQAAVDPEWSVTYGLLRKSTIGAVITTWRSVLIKPWITESLCRAVLRGVPVGKALAQFNRSAACKSIGFQMCLTGDPRTHLPVDSQYSSQLLGNIDQGRKSVAISEEDIKEIRFLRAFYTMLVPRLKSEELRRLGMNLLRAVLAYEGAAWLGSPLEGDESAPGPVMREAVLRFLVHEDYWGNLDLSWLAFAKSVRAETKPRLCVHCQRDALAVTARLRALDLLPRRFSTCPRCGVIEDAPVHSRIDFMLSVRGSTVSLTGNLPQQHWNAMIHLRTKHPSASKAFEWPRRPDGSPADCFTISEPWPAGPMTVYLYMLWEANFAIKSAMTG